MIFRYTITYIELVAALAMTLGLYEGLHPLWRGWLPYALLFLDPVGLLRTKAKLPPPADRGGQWESI